MILFLLAPPSVFDRIRLNMRSSEIGVAILNVFDGAIAAVAAIALMLWVLLVLDSARSRASRQQNGRDVP